MKCCYTCHLEFEPKRKCDTFCSYPCKALFNRKSEQEKNEAANKRWLEPKKETNWNFKKGNEHMEYKRLYDDESWLNRFQGRRG